MQEMTGIKRVLLKLSGEVLMGSREHGIEPEFLGRMASRLVALAGMGWQLGLVVGGGNIFRGLSASAAGMDRVSADQMGMLATVMNGLALQGAIEQAGGRATVMTALTMPQVAEGFSRRGALAALEAGRIVIFVAGTGNPYFTTDTAAALRAVEIGADLLLKGTKVDGVYDRDPRKDPEAKRFERLDYQTVLERRLGVMDLTAIALCRENRLPVFVFSILDPDILPQLPAGGVRGTLIQEA